MTKRRIIPLLGALTCSLLAVYGIFIAIYMPVVGHGRLAAQKLFPVLGYMFQTIGTHGPAHPLAADVPYKRPLGVALEALSRSLLLVASTLAVAALISFLFFVILDRLNGTRGNRHVWTHRILRPLVDGVQQLQRLPGLALFLLVQAIVWATRSSFPSNGLPAMLVFVLILANSDGIAPDLSSLLVQRARDLEERDYIRVSLLEGRGRLRCMARELAISGVDLLGNRFLSVLGGAFLLELLFRFPGIGYLVIRGLFLSVPPDRASMVADMDSLFGALVLLLACSGVVVVVRKALLAWLDPRVRTIRVT